MSPLCLIRGLLRTVRIGARVSGHDFELQPPETGQPRCVEILKCAACGKISISWSRCLRCGHGLRDQ